MYIYRCTGVNTKRKKNGDMHPKTIPVIELFSSAAASKNIKFLTPLTMQIHIGSVFVLPLIFFRTQDTSLDFTVSTLRPITPMTSSFSYYASSLPAGLTLRDFALCILIAKL